MRFIPNTEGDGFPQPTLAETLKPVEGPETGEVVSAFLRTENTAVVAFNFLRQTFATPQEQRDPDFSSYEILLSKDFPPHYFGYKRLRGAQSADEFYRVLSEIQKEEQLRETMEHATTGQLFAAMGAGIVTDPIFLFPFARAAWGARVAARPVSVGRITAETTGIVLAEEVLKHAAQDARTTEESLFMVGSAAMLAGALGGAIKLMTPDEAMKALRDFQNDIHLAAGSKTPRDILEEGMSAGARHALEEVLDGNQISNLDRAMTAFAKLPRIFQSPALRMGISLVPEVRLAGERLASLNLSRKKNLEGRAALPSAEAMSYEMRERWGRQYQQATLVKYADYRTRVKSTGQSPLEEAQFFEEMHMAGIRAKGVPTEKLDELFPDSPEIVAGLREIRAANREIIKRAEDAGMLEPGHGLTDDWMPRFANQALIRANVDEVEGVVANWMRGNETLKQQQVVQAQEIETRLKELDRQIAAETRRAERASMSADQLAAREEELTRINKRLFGRSETIKGQAKRTDASSISGEVDTLARTIDDDIGNIDDLLNIIAVERGNFPELSGIDTALSTLRRSARSMTKDADALDLTEAIRQADLAIKDLDDLVSRSVNTLGEVADEIRGQAEFASIARLRGTIMDIREKAAPVMRAVDAERATTANILARGKKAEVGATQAAVRGRQNVVADRKAGKIHKADDHNAAIERLKAERAKLDDEARGLLTEYKGKSAMDALGPIKRGEKGTSANKLVRRALRRVARRPAMMDAEVDSLASQIVNNYGNVHGMRLPYKEPTRVRGYIEKSFARRSMMGRQWEIPDEVLFPYLNHDLPQLFNAHVRTMGADISLMESFKTLDVQEVLTEMRDASKRMAKKANLNPTQKEKFFDRVGYELKLFEGMWDRHRGTMANWDHTGRLGIAERAMLAFSFITRMGSLVLASLPDLGNFSGRELFQGVLSKSLMHAAKQTEGWKLAKAEAARNGYALERTVEMMAARHYDMPFDTMGGKIDRFFRKGQDFSALVSGAQHWNNGLRAMGSIFISDGMIKYVGVWAKGGKITAKQKEALARNFIDLPLARRIDKQFAKYGVTEDGIRVANLEKWDDLEAANIFRASVNNQVGELITTPGQHKALWMDKPGLRLIAQFKGFGYGAQAKILGARLQQGDAKAASAVAMGLFLGSMIYVTRTSIAGREVELTPGRLLAEAIWRSGIGANLYDIINPLEKVSGYSLAQAVGLPAPSRFQNRTALSSVMGSSFGIGEGLLAGVGAMAQGEAPPTAFYRSLPFSSHPMVIPIISALQDN